MLSDIYKDWVKTLFRTMDVAEIVDFTGFTTAEIEDALR